MLFAGRAVTRQASCDGLRTPVWFRLMVARAIVSAFTALSLSAYAYGAEIHDRPDVEWPTGNRIAPGWDITIDGEIVPGDDVTFRATLNRVKTTKPQCLARHCLAQLAGWQRFDQRAHCRLDQSFSSLDARRRIVCVELFHAVHGWHRSQVCA